MTLFGCSNPLNIASTDYVDCVVTTVSGALQEQIDQGSSVDFPNSKSVYLNGINSFFQKNNVNSNDIGAGINLTINLWAKLSDNSDVQEGWSNLMDFQASSTAGDRIRFIAMHNFGGQTRTFYYEAGNGTGHQSVDNVYNFDQWHMFTVDVNNTQYKMYIDGVLKSLESSDTAVDLNAGAIAPFRIGFGDIDNYVRGVMRHVSIHSGSLSSTMIQAMYNGGTAIDLRVNQGSYNQASNLRHYWFLGDADDFGPEGIRDRVGSIHLTASGSPIVVLDTPHRNN